MHKIRGDEPQNKDAEELLLPLYPEARQIRTPIGEGREIRVVCMEVLNVCMYV